MTLSETEAARFADPWPTAQPTWPRAPWLMSGTVATAWFALPAETIERLLSRSLLPALDDTRPSRLRFYDIAFRSEAEPERTPGHFREAVVAFPAAYSGQLGEVSAFMWSDDETYQTWGREVFGWPVLHGSFELAGSLWTSSPGRDGLSGSSTLRGAGEATLRVDRLVERLGPSAPAAWLTPRLIPSLSDASERRELLCVTPEVVEPGARWSAEGSAAIDFPAGHPLHGVTLGDCEVEVTTGFTLRVGHKVARL